MIQHFSKRTAEGTEFSTSSGFNAFGRPLKYRSASDAGVALRLTPAMPEDGLIFYAPLTDTNGFEVTGTPQFATIDNIPCMYFDGETYLSTTSDAVPQGTSPRSISFWFRAEETSDEYEMFMSMGSPDYDSSFAPGIHSSSGQFQVYCYYNDTSYSFYVEPNQFYHIVVTYDDGDEMLYVNGEYIQSRVHDGLTTSGDTIVIGAEFHDWCFNGHMAAVRIYNKALTNEEIIQLATEFQRCVSVTCPDCGETYCATCDTHNCTSGGGSETPTDPDDPVVPDIPEKDDDICQWGTCTEVHSYQCASCLGYFCGNHLAGPYDSPNGEIYYCLACEQGNI